MDQDELEEGEISDGDTTSYTPLERPADYSSQNNRFATAPIVQSSDSEIELRSSDSGSDSDGGKIKKPKVKLKSAPKQADGRRKKYDVWCLRAQEDVLQETLFNFDVSKKDRSRDVETYDRPGAQCYTRTNNKRSRDDRKNPNVKSVGRQWNQKKVKGSARNILSLAVNKDSSNEAVASDIANKLSEEKEDLILRVINALGYDKTVSLYEETKRIEEEGGMLIMNQTRRRTPGGVFLFLIRQDDEITGEQRDVIFDDEKQKSKVVQRNKQKKKIEHMKQKMTAKNKLLPDLLTRAQLLANDSNRVRKASEERDVINPPPTPETDGHENSGDGMDTPESGRKLPSYDDDFLDIGLNDMDLF